MSPVPAERCIGARELTEPRLSPDGSMLVYAASSAVGAALMLSLLDGEAPRQLTSYPPPRPGRSMGGGCWCWTPDSRAVLYVGADGNVWMQPVPGGAVRRLTDHGPERVAQAPMVHPTNDSVVYVIDQCEVWCQPFDGSAPQRLDRADADFCFDPWVTSCGTTVVWQAWNVPDMAWDAGRVQRATFDGAVYDDARLAGAVQQPRTLLDGRAIFVCDVTGWNNVWLDEAPLVDEPFEHADPTWGMGQRSFAVSPDERHVAFARNEAGFGRLCVVEIASGRVIQIGRGVHGQLSWAGTSLAAIRTGATTPTQVVVYDTSALASGGNDAGEPPPRRVIDVGPVSGWEREPLVEPEPIQLQARDGATLHGRLYRADDPARGMICWLHGGPTDQWQVTFMPRIAYWRSRGWHVWVPDHRGSTGHGRAYQQAMNERWGELDVTDVIDAVRFAHAQAWATPRETVMMGGSAGGFTVLGLIRAAPELVGAAAVSYPVSDLADLAEHSHRFERHYTHHLVAPLPPQGEGERRYRDRSPVSFAGEISTSLLILHGDDDPVVPVEQSIHLATAIAHAGGLVELHVYEQEGHGFRRPVNQLDEYERIGAFLREYVPERAR